MKGKDLIEEAQLFFPQKLNEEEGGSASGTWKASVWHLDQVNRNGRIYSSELAARIVKENKVTMAFDGHDADWRSGNEYGIAKAVCKNPRIEGGDLVVDIEFVDKAFEERLELLNAKGVSIGVSSVGFGEVDENGRVVPETFTLIRYLDFVSVPAGDVYAKKESQEEGEADVMTEAEKSELSEKCRNLAKKILNIRS